MMQEFENRQALEIVLSNRIASIVKQNLLRKERVSLLFSGGNTPKGLLNRLATMPFEWHRLCIGLVDDRMVPADSPYSNTALIKNELLAHIPAIESLPLFLPLVTTDDDFEKNLQALKANINQLGNIDILLLGMGLDGHFASLFAQDDASSEALRNDFGATALYTKAPNFPKNRISFSWPYIRSAQHIFLHITGVAKKQLLQKAQKDSRLPIHTLLHNHQNNLEIVWAP
jgi:6-phosphogluconolactonase